MGAGASVEGRAPAAGFPETVKIQARVGFPAGGESSRFKLGSWSPVYVTITNDTEQNLPIEDTTNRLRDRGNSSVDRPQAVTLSAVLEPQVKLKNRVFNKLLSDNMFAILGNFSSGDAQNIVANHRLNGDSTTDPVTRPLFVGRNTARTPNIYQVDLRYTRAIARLWERVTPQFSVEANNLFNHPNVTSINATATVNTDPTKGLVGSITKPATLVPTSTVLEGRIVQFGVGLRW